MSMPICLKKLLATSLTFQNYYCNRNCFKLQTKIRIRKDVVVTLKNKIHTPVQQFLLKSSFQRL